MKVAKGCDYSCSAPFQICIRYQVLHRGATSPTAGPGDHWSALPARYNHGQRSGLRRTAESRPPSHRLHRGLPRIRTIPRRRSSARTYLRHCAMLGGPHFNGRTRVEDRRRIHACLILRVHRLDPGDDFPEVAGFRNSRAALLRHQGGGLRAYPRETRFLQFLASQCNEPEQGVVARAVNPHAIVEWRTDASAAVAAVATIATVILKLLVTL